MLEAGDKPLGAEQLQLTLGHIDVTVTVHGCANVWDGAAQQFCAGVTPRWTDDLTSIGNHAGSATRQASLVIVAALSSA